MASTGLFVMLYAAFSFHVLMFGLEVIMSIILVSQLYIEIFTGKEFFRREARKFMSYIAVTYASAHFFLTATTVMALTFFPDFLVLAGNLLFYPLGYIIAVLILRLLMISYFWYGWDKVPKKLHLAAGTIFAGAGVIWVYFYTVVLSFMNVSRGLVSIDPIKVNPTDLFLNPTTIPLLLVIVFGAIAVTTGFLIFYYGRSILTRKQIIMPDSEYQYRLFQYHTYNGFAATLLFMGSLFWYLSALGKHSNYKYRNWMGTIFGQEPTAVNLGWLFMIMLVLFGVIMIVWGRSVYMVFKTKYHEEVITEYNKWQFLSIGPVLAVIFELFILLNFISQAPYFFISPFRDHLDGMSISSAVNEYADVIDIYSLSIFGFVPLLVAFGSLLYYFFTGRMNTYGESTPQ